MTAALDPRMPVAILPLAMVYWLAPPVILLMSAMLASMSHLQLPALAASLIAAGFWMLICWGMKIPAAYGLGYPLGALMTLYISVRSTWRGARRVEWRGRVYGTAER